MERVTVPQLRSYLQSKGITAKGKKRQLFSRFQTFVENSGGILETIIDEEILGLKPKPEEIVEETKDDELKPGDSASQISGGSKSRISGVSKTGSVASLRAAAAAKQAALEVRLRKRKEQEELRKLEQEMKMRELELEQEMKMREQEMKMKEEDIKFRQETINLEIEWEAIEAERKALRECAKGKDDSILSFRQTKVDFSIPNDRDGIGKKVKDDDGSVVTRINLGDNLGGKAEVSQRCSEFDTSTGLCGPSLTDPPVEMSQGELMKNLISCNLKGFMPSQELKRFSGSYTEYFVFSHSFDSIIADKLNTDQDRLHYLEQYTVGKPNEIVRACLHLNPEEGYARARELLDRRYGNRDQISAAYVERVLSWPSIARDDVHKLDEFSIELASCLNAMSSMACGLVQLDNPKTMHVILEKLPYSLQERWRRSVDKISNRQHRVVKFKDLVSFVEDEVRIMTNPVFGKQTFKGSEKDVKNRSQKGSGVHQVKAEVVNETGNSLSCWYCKGEHVLDDCLELANKSFDVRFRALRDMNVCFLCLRKGHRSSNCNSRKRCDKCTGRHATILHRDLNGDRSDRDSSGLVGVPVQDDSAGKKISIFSSGIKDMHGGMSVVPVKVMIAGREVETRAFLDNGSSSSFCTRELLNALGCKSFPEVNLTVSTINGDKVMRCGSVHGLTVTDIDGNNHIEMPPLFAIDKIPVAECDVINNRDLAQWKHLQDVPLYDSSGTIGLMIGTNVPQALEPWKVVNSRRQGEPYAMKTKLGWVVCGIRGDANVVSVHRTSVDWRDRELIDSYNKDFQDLASCRHQLSIDDKLWLRLVDEGCRQVGNKNYEIPLPLKEGFDTLPDSKPAALKRLNSLKKKFKDKDYFEQYKQFMDKLLERGYAEVIQSSDRQGSSRWFLPHFGVCHPDKPDSIRVVFDCAAKVGDLSLNDLLLQGPDINNLLLGVLLKFRTGQNAYSADIETMFYQVKVPPDQRDYLRFLWWEDGDVTKDIIEMRMTAHPFGACCSPSVANYALQRAVVDYGHLFSVDTRVTVESCFYVDDCMKSGDCLDELIINGREVKQLCCMVGFNLNKYVSHSKDFLNSFPKADLGKDMVGYLEGKPVCTKALGLSWDLLSDTIGVSIRDVVVPITKRELLSIIAAVYDPLGILAPVVLEGRIIMQELCRLGLSWDAPIDGPLRVRIQDWICKLDRFRCKVVDRCIKPCVQNEIESLQWHFFCDASLLGYGVVVYLRIEDKNGKIYCRFVIGKCRVAPLKAVSIPRLELMAATLAVKMKEVLTNEVCLDFTQVFLWTDSTTVLQYIRNDQARYQTFVANRVTLIRDGSDKSQWHYVASNLNPADDCSRAKQTDRWLIGPEFLLQDSEFWPVEVEYCMAASNQLEIRKEFSLKATVEEKLPFQKMIEYFSSWVKLKVSVAWYVRYLNYLRHKDSSVKTLSVWLLEFAGLAVIRYEQKRQFKLEYEALICDKTILKSSSLIRLKPVMINGIIRVGGRLGSQELQFDERHPIILPYKSHVTDLLVEHYHIESGHMGRQYILGQLRAKYWIVKGNSAVRRVLAKCIDCRRYKGKVIEQEMAKLPVDRAHFDQPPFYVTGVDCFGPFMVKVGRSRVKRYGVIFTCLTIRAVHLEVAVDLSTDAFINALRRFLSRRGQVRKIICDRGTNFVGASNILASQNSVFGKSVARKLLERGIEWEFTPPGASHYGGTWERMIGCVRRVLEVIMGVQVMTDDSLVTMFCEIEAIVNSRPLSVPSSDVNDISPITPNLILNMGRSPEAIISSDEAVNYSKYRWKQTQYMADQFWSRWRKEYFTSLQERQKWQRDKRNVSVGDIVLVVDENTARCHWPLARVVKVTSSDDGLVRRVHVRRGNKVIERPISKLVMILEDEAIGGS